jgi:para-nitrobenzyl esterase
MVPQAPQPWKNARDCTKPGPRAIQGPGSIFTNPAIGAYFSGGTPDAAQRTYQPDSENCLVLNVLTPGLRGHRPVMVYIHGGGFSGGSGILTALGDRFVAEVDVVLVGINHRLNMFGYTYLGDIDPKYEDSGNVGQLDLIAALQWVKKNISNFGGDAGNVTIFGESGGGAKVSTLLAMPAAKGLFRRAIIQSGSLLKVRTKEAATEDAKNWLQKLGVKSASELLTIPAEQLLKVPAAQGGMGPGPVIDGRSIPHQTWDRGAPPEAAGVDLLVGNCKDESTLFVGMSGSQLFSLDWDSLKKEVIKRGIPEEISVDLIASYRQDYPSESASDIYFRLSSDQGARRNALTQAELKLAQNSGKVYMYHFDWNTPVDGGKLRAFHTADLPLEMRLVLYPEAEELSRQLAGAWAAFARTGDPNHKGLAEWAPYSLEKRATMSFDIPTSQVIFNPAGTQLKIMRPYPGGLL